MLAARPFLLFWGVLPEPMAVHWTVGGHPDGAMGKARAAVLLVAMPAPWAAVGALIIRFGRGPAVHIGALLGGVGALVAVVTWADVLANVHAPTWHQAGAAVVFGLIPAFVVGGAVTLVVWRLAPGTAGPPAPGPPSTGPRARRRRGPATSGGPGAGPRPWRSSASASPSSRSPARASSACR